MNHKRLHKATHKAKNSPNPLLFWGGGILAVILIAGILFTQVANSKSDFTPLVTDAPSVEILQGTVDHGDVPVNKPVRSEFKIRNVGDQPLILRDNPVVEVVEGCCPPKAVLSDTRLEPGEIATVKMEYSMHVGMAGQHELRVHVITNDRENPEIFLTAFSNWIE